MALVFLFGCAVGGTASQVAIAPANAEQAAVMTKWEYLRIDRQDGADKMTHVVNDAGLQGWEAFAVDASTGAWFLKRPRGSSPFRYRE